MMKPLQRNLKMNKTEYRYAGQLDLLKQTGDILDWRFENIRLKIGEGGQDAYYKPDFFVIKADGFEFHETKGWWREAARVRIKAAAYLFPWFKFIGVRWINNQWEFEEF